MNRADFLQIQQLRVARLAASLSAMRNQGPGVVKAARDYLDQLDLAQFAEGDGREVRGTLDAVTEAYCDVVLERNVLDEGAVGVKLLFVAAGVVRRIAGAETRLPAFTCRA